MVRSEILITSEIMDINLLVNDSLSLGSVYHLLAFIIITISLVVDIH